MYKINYEIPLFYCMKQFTKKTVDDLTNDLKKTNTYMVEMFDASQK